MRKIAPEIFKIDLMSSKRVFILKRFFKLVIGFSFLISGFIDSNEKRGPTIKKLVSRPTHVVKKARGKLVVQITVIACNITWPIRSWICSADFMLLKVYVR